MFKNLLDLSYIRTKLEAVGFYIAYLLGVMLGAAGVAAVAAPYIPQLQGDFEAGVKVGAFFAILVCVSLSVVLAHNRQMNGVSVVLAGIGTLILSGLGGGLLGLLIPAYLTTQAPSTSVLVGASPDATTPSVPSA